MVKIFSLLIFFFSFFFLPGQFVYAGNGKAYVTIVNPIRGRSIWKNSDLLKPQIQMIVDKKLPATWLIQYEVLHDEEILNLLKNLPKTQEIGLFLEVDETLATQSLVPYLLGEGDWARADKVLLSGYLPSERKRMIDSAFDTFKTKFGFYPESVGSWYIDTLSLDYIVEKFGVSTILDVTDQFQTDGYGVWGKPWGTPYYPSRFNSLIPAQGKEDKVNAVKIQWAQRDPVSGFGKTTFDSTYSVQANDYIGHHGLTSLYFQMLAGSYLFSRNPLTQLTIGLEAGQEGVFYTDELKRQIEILEKFQKEKDITFVTMKDFAQYFKTAYPDSSPNFFIEGKDINSSMYRAFWFTTPFYRIGLLQDGGDLKLRDFRIYSNQLLFSDIGKRDGNETLKRIIPSCITEAAEENMRKIITDVKKIDIARNGDEIEIKGVKKEGNEETILLQSDKVLVNNKIFLNAKEKESFQQKLRTNFFQSFISYTVNASKTAPAGFRFSNINGVNYFGFMIEPDKLIGVQMKPFRIGTFEFPFQVLTRFKTFPQVDIGSLLSGYFIREMNQCTINL